MEYYRLKIFKKTFSLVCSSLVFQTQQTLQYLRDQTGADEATVNFDNVYLIRGGMLCEVSRSPQYLVDMVMGTMHYFHLDAELISPLQSLMIHFADNLLCIS